MLDGKGWERFSWVGICQLIGLISIQFFASCLPNLVFKCKYNSVFDSLSIEHCLALCSLLVGEGLYRMRERREMRELRVERWREYQELLPRAGSFGRRTADI